ncbi:glycoside hydrolase family 66 protein [Paenibacillus gansuensis]|uniref:Glycoside hydrolase family 66 protein n=1 Tax=Paenibacillus gansuensis TaxID=306542 RepID=A0ABW5PLT5_9BACL
MLQTLRRPAVLLAVFTLAVLPLAGCTSSDKAVTLAKELPAVQAGSPALAAVSTDKAAYKPGEAVKFTLKLDGKAGDGGSAGTAGGTLLVQYRHLGTIVSHTEMKVKEGAADVSWEWTPPKDDYRGYLAEVLWKTDGGKWTGYATIAVDVSSDWGKFPRYGYLADFGPMQPEERTAVVERLNRFHLNGLQFYDWQWKHHMPLKLEADGQPAAAWPDIANRDTSLETVKGYIDLAHKHGMKAMNYNLLFGAYDDYETDGVKRDWGLFKDPLAENQDRHPLPDSWASDIQLMNPGNQEWMDYLFTQEKKVQEHLPFDGWHVDQLGNRGTLYTAQGKSVNLMLTYGEMLVKAKQAVPGDYVMNAVEMYGQMLIAKAPVKFLYAELWGAYPKYSDLKKAIDENAKYGGGKLNSVLAAYMNYDMADSAGEFNLPGVLLTDAVIYASGGSHIAMGENMLAKEYFPNKSLKITPELEQRLTAYYDFLTAYQNLLRDGAVEDGKAMAASGNIPVSANAEAGKVWTFTKQAGSSQVVHLINFVDAAHMEWRDGKGTQAKPIVRKDVEITVPVKGKVKQAWMASPDMFGGSPIPLDVKQKDRKAAVTLPSLEYWDMVVFDFE